MVPSSASSSYNTTLQPGSHQSQQHHRRRSSSLRRAAASAAAAAAADASSSSSSSSGGLLALEIVFLDNTSRAFSLPRGATAGDLVRVVVERLGLSPGHEEDMLPFFGLMESYTGTTLDRPVNKAEPLAALVAPAGPDHPDAQTHSSSPQSKLVFLLRAPGFACLRRLSLRDPALLYHRYIQAVHAVITATLPSLFSSRDDGLLRLACLQLRARFGRGGSGSGSDDVCDSAFARALGPRIVEYVPASVFREKTAAEWREGMAALLDADRALRRLSETEAQRAYLSLVEARLPPVLGAALFPDAVADPGTASAREAVLAVDGAGLAVYDPLDVGKGPLSRVALEAMAQWGFYPQGGRGLFYYTLKREGAPVVVNFETAQGAAICETLTGTAYAFLKNAEVLGRWEEGEEEGKGEGTPKCMSMA